MRAANLRRGPVPGTLTVSTVAQAPVRATQRGHPHASLSTPSLPAGSGPTHAHPEVPVEAVLIERSNGHGLLALSRCDKGIARRLVEVPARRTSAHARRDHKGCPICAAPHKRQFAPSPQAGVFTVPADGGATGPRLQGPAPGAPACKQSARAFMSRLGSFTLYHFLVVAMTLLRALVVPSQNDNLFRSWTSWCFIMDTYGVQHAWASCLMLALGFEKIARHVHSLRYNQHSNNPPHSRIRHCSSAL
jgi:hypothetical protein